MMAEKVIIRIQSGVVADVVKTSDEIEVIIMDYDIDQADYSVDENLLEYDEDGNQFLRDVY